MSYLSHTLEERARMLDVIGVHDIAELFRDVPEQLRIDELDIPEGISELEVTTALGQLAGRNQSLETCPSFLGGGAYFGFVPAAVGAITGRAEFYTSYTPYQPELSQGTLQVIYEFQSMIALLTGLDVANASLYDGATAVAEAAAMTLNATGRGSVAVASSLNPEYRAVLQTYADGVGYSVDVLDLDSAGSETVSTDHAALIVQNPDFFGSILDMKRYATLAHEKGALFVSVVDPISLALLASPGEYGADIAVGEGQNLGSWLSFGGPYLGFIACRTALQRRLPGRIAGATVDDRGQPAYVLTLQTREQHIRREKATSNICTNEGLVALAATVYMALMGPEGLRRVASLAAQKAHFAAQRIAGIEGFEMLSRRPFFREFTMRAPLSPSRINGHLLDRGIIGGVDVSRAFGGDERCKNCISFACTERTSRSDIDRLVEALTELSRPGVEQSEAIAEGVA